MRRTFKRYLIAKAPPVLVVHLKRFQQLSKTSSAIFGNLKKLDDVVPFPEYLDLSAYLAPRREDFSPAKGDRGRHLYTHAAAPIEPQESCLYRLVSVVVHIGNMLGGHYVAYTALSDLPSTAETKAPTTPSEATTLPTKSTKTSPRRWCYISDTIVRTATLDEVLKSKAYICMYERLDTVPGVGGQAARL